MSEETKILEVLERSRALGLLGPGEIVEHIRHAKGFVAAVGDASTILDLGSGGGLPGLVLAVELPEARVTLLDASERRVAFLRDAVRRLELHDRVTVICGRAEALARDDHLREKFDAVVARSFASPAITAECAAGFLRLDGVAYISEPAEIPDRWPSDALLTVGLSVGDVLKYDDSSIRQLHRIAIKLEHVPRSVGVPARRPLFT